MAAGEDPPIATSHEPSEKDRHLVVVANRLHGILLTDLLHRRWPVLQHALAGKLHITTGGLDTFYLEGAVEQLIGTLKQLGSDAEVEVVPGKDHGSVLTAELRSRQRRQMTALFAKYHPEHMEAAVSP